MRRVVRGNLSEEILQLSSPKIKANPEKNGGQTAHDNTLMQENPDVCKLASMAGIQKEAEWTGGGFIQASESPLKEFIF